MGEDPFDVAAARQGAAIEQAGDGACGVEREIQGRRRIFRLALVARGGGGVEIDHRAAPVELVEYRREIGIAGIFAAVIGEQADAVGLELVERMADFRQARIHVRQGQAGEDAEALGMVAAQLGGVVVGAAAQALRRLGIAEPEAGRRDRRQRGGDAVAVHRLDRDLRAPGRRLVGDADRADEIVADLGDIVGRQDVVMDVDAVRGHAGPGSVWNGVNALC